MACYYKCPVFFAPDSVDIRYPYRRFKKLAKCFVYSSGCNLRKLQTKELKARCRWSKICQKVRLSRRSSIQCRTSVRHWYLVTHCCNPRI